MTIEDGVSGTGPERDDEEVVTTVMWPDQYEIVATAQDDEMSARPGVRDG